MNNDEDQTTQAISNNTSPFHFTEVDTVDKPEIGFTTPTFIALTTGQTTIKRYFSADQAETDFGFDSNLYKQIANYFSNDGNVSQLVLVLFNPAQVNPTVSVTGVSLNKATLNGVVGGTDTVSAIVAPTNATNKSVTYTSSDSTVATVDATGKVTFIKPGTATITAQTNDGSYTATCEVTVAASGATAGGSTAGGSEAG